MRNVNVDLFRNKRNFFFQITSISKTEDGAGLAVIMARSLMRRLSMYSSESSSAMK